MSQAADSTLILGIDLGTTHSLVGVVDAGLPILLADADGSRLTPSAVFFPPDDGAAPVIGAAALRQRVPQPGRTVTSVKRLIGRRPGEGEWLPAYRLGGLGTSAVEVSAIILAHLRGVAERAMGVPITRAVITVPAFFNDAQRAATKRAGEIAGLTVERILSEPTAAALAFGLQNLTEHKKVAVYDLGGGTFDLSILEMREGVFQVLATAGDTQLGGDDIDRGLAEWLWESFDAGGRRGLAEIEPGMRARLIEAAEAAKRKLSSAEQARVELPFFEGQRSLCVDATRADLERIARPLIERTRACCLRALADARLEPEDLDAVLLVGGSTRMPLVRQLAARIFGREPDVSQNPDEAIALGAVVQAGILAGSLRQMLLLDVTPLSLGIETFGGLMNVIIPRNSTLPCKAGELFTNAVAGQDSMLIRVLQGERELARDNWELGKVCVPFLPGAKGSARVGVQFSIDADGILQVLARDTATGEDTVLKIQGTAVDVTDERVEKMIAESVEFAFDDMNERAWTEAGLKAAELLPAVAEAMAQAGDAITEEERRAINEGMRRLRAALDSPDHNARELKAATLAVDEATQALAVVLVERAMEESLARRGVI